MSVNGLLLLTDFYPPGFRSGGPARSCYNLALGLGKGTPVQVLTRDRDLHCTLPYPDVPADTPINFAPGVQVTYLSPPQLGFRAILRRLRQSPEAVIYLNSMFSLPFTIFPLLAHYFGALKSRIVLAPRGMLKPSALQFKPLKKRLFLGLFRVLGLHRKLVFQASSAAEALDIQAVFGSSAAIVVCPPVPEISLPDRRKIKPKAPGITRFCMVGRIHPIKNIRQALQQFAQVQSPVWIDVIGPFEDPQYLAECQAVAANLPACVRVQFHGALEVSQTHALLDTADFFYLLTLGENFGHAIFEALALGKPVIISDQTPWRNLSDKQAGWDLSLQSEADIQQALRQAIQMADPEYQHWSQGAFEHAQTYIAESDWLPAYKRLFFP